MKGIRLKSCRITTSSISSLKYGTVFIDGPVTCRCSEGEGSLLRTEHEGHFSEGSLFRRVIVPKGHDSEYSMFVNPKAQYSEYRPSIRFVNPKGHYSE